VHKILNEIFMNQKINLIGSGRTDAGVHANSQIANIALETTMAPNQIKNAINRKLPNDIYIHDCQIVPDSFHARFSAIKREYNYYIISDYSTTKRFYTWFCKWPLDYDKLTECSNLLIGQHDFSLFSKASSETENKICTIYISDWIKDNDMLVYNIKANRFLQHMVRLLVGTMIEVSRGRIALIDFKRMLDCKKTKFTAVRAPANGLFLHNIYYD